MERKKSIRDDGSGGQVADSKPAGRGFGRALLLLGSAAIMGSCNAPERSVVENPASATSQELAGGTRLTQRESMVILSLSKNRARLRAEVLVYNIDKSASEPSNLRAVMRGIVSSCQSSKDMQKCIVLRGNEKVDEGKEEPPTVIPGALVDFRYWNEEEREWTDIGVGSSCDLTNYRSATIWAIFIPEIGSGIKPSGATFRMPPNLSLDSD